MVGAIVLSPTDAASQESVVGSAQRVVVARARAPRDVAVQHCLEYLGSQDPDFDLEGSALLRLEDMAWCTAAVSHLKLKLYFEVKTSMFAPFMYRSTDQPVFLML